MESHIAAKVAQARGLPFAIVRIISDEVGHLLPHAITVSMRPDGGIHAVAMMRRAVNWLESVQNADGGWGESCDSYALDRTGHIPAPSIASQTGWALLALMAAGEVDGAAVARGIAWLQANQAADGLWPQDHYTGGGFPRVFYLRYHGYPKYFPLWALARYRNLKRGNLRRPVEGM
jgi:squalene-hopene/tetraprenyl-beta-curcumene cyclase